MSFFVYSSRFAEEAANLLLFCFPYPLVNPNLRIIIDTLGDCYG